MFFRSSSEPEETEEEVESFVTAEQVTERADKEGLNHKWKWGE